MKSSSESPLGVGLYTVSDAARLLRTPSRTLSRWVAGYVATLRNGPKSYAPVLARSESLSLTFGDLVELMYVREFRRIKVSLEEIRNVARIYRDRWQVDYPFATKKFAVEGTKLLANENASWREALTGQGTMFAQLAKELVHVGDLSCVWRPLGEEHEVVLDPERAFGKPIDHQSGTHTFVLYSAVEKGETPASVAWFYGTSIDSVKDAVAFEQDFGARVPVR